MSIKFSNGHEFTFACASGALAYDGEGWWFERPWRWLKLIRPEELTIITKTLTPLPRKGNYLWYKPWRAVQLIEDGVVNAFGLTNDGYLSWIEKVYPYICYKKYKVILSIMLEDLDTVRDIAIDINRLKNLVGVEINPRCPNVKHNETTSMMCEMISRYVAYSDHPVAVKLGYDDPYMDVCAQLDGKVAAFDLINAVQWRTVFPNKRSPLSAYGLVGAVSGNRIKKYALEAAGNYRKAGFKTPLMSGGAINTYEDVVQRLTEIKADAVTFGTVFMRYPWRPNMYIARWNREHA